jgi:hypothetical protein
MLPLNTVCLHKTECRSCKLIMKHILEWVQQTPGTRNPVNMARHLQTESRSWIIFMNHMLDWDTHSPGTHNIPSEQWMSPIDWIYIVHTILEPYSVLWSNRPGTLNVTGEHCLPSSYWIQIVKTIHKSYEGTSNRNPPEHVILPVNILCLVQTQSRSRLIFRIHFLDWEPYRPRKRNVTSENCLHSSDWIQKLHTIHESYTALRHTKVRNT